MKNPYIPRKHQEYIDAIHKYLDINKWDGAYKICIEALTFFPESFALYYYLALIAQRQNKNEECTKYANQAILLYNAKKITEHDIPYLNNIGIIFFRLKFYQTAQECFAAYLVYKPNDYSGLYNMGQLFLTTHLYEQALEWFLKAEKTSLTYNVLFYAGLTFNHLKKLDKAEEYYLRALQKEPNNPRVYYMLGIVHQHNGSHTEAIHYLKKSLQLCPTLDQAYHALSEMNGFTNDVTARDEAIKEIHGLLKRTNLIKSTIYNLNYALGHLYNAKGEYNTAYLHYSNANIYKSDFSTFDILKYKSGTKRYLQTFNANLIDTLQPFSNSSQMPSFIVGMPRSGTTLTEQIITSHSKAISLGESHNIGSLPDSIEVHVRQQENRQNLYYPELLTYCASNIIQHLSEGYLKQVQKNASNETRIFDKMPDNSFNIGLIKILFPSATIIHCKRHPLDIVFSMFSSNFIESNFPNNLEFIAEYYLQYHTIMKHWHNLFPGQIYDSYYEELVMRPIEKSKELIAACNLEWEEACLTFYSNNNPVYTASHSQVKNPIYFSSVFRWKNYAPYLAPIKDILRNEIQAYEEEIVTRVPALATQL